MKLKQQKNIALLTRITSILTLLLSVFLIIGFFGSTDKHNAIGDIIGLTILIGLMIVSIFLLKEADHNATKIKHNILYYLLPLMVLITAIVIWAGGGFALLPFAIYAFAIVTVIKINNLEKGSSKTR